MAKGASLRSGAAPAGVLRTHTSGRLWVTVRPKYVGLPARAGRGPDERGRKPAGSGRAHAPRPVPEARSRSPKSPPVERREASASSHDAHRASHARTVGAPSGAPLPLILFSGRRKRTTAYPAPQTTRAAERWLTSSPLPRGERSSEARVRGFGRRDLSETSEPPHPDPLPNGEREQTTKKESP